MHAVGVIPALVVLFATAVAAYTDVSRYKVYNVLTGPLILSGVLYHSIAAETAGLALSLGGALLAFGMLLLPYLIGGLGAGDVKFTIGLGAWLGGQVMIPIVLLGALATLAYGVVLAMVSGRMRETGFGIKLVVYQLLTIGRYLVSDDRHETVVAAAQSGKPGRLIPFTAMIGLGVVVVVTWLQLAR